MRFHKAIEASQLLRPENLFGIALACSPERKIHGIEAPALIVLISICYEPFVSL
jgi:hypothetical protein